LEENIWAVKKEMHDDANGRRDMANVEGGII